MLTNFIPKTDAQDVIMQLRIRAVQVLLIFILVASVVLAITIQLEDSLFSFSGIVSTLAAGLSAGGLAIVHRGRNVRTIGTSAVIYLVLVSIFSFTGDFDILIILLMLATVSAAIISPRLIFWLVNALSITATVWFVTYSGKLGAELAELDRTIFPVIVTLLLTLLPPVLGLMLRFFIDRLEAVARNSQRTAALLEASANIGQNVSQMLELDELLKRSVEIVRDRFAFYHVQIFLIDEAREYAYLQASTGEVGEQMLARGHRLPLAADSVIGRVTLSGEPIIARDADQDKGHAFNELLPDTRSELAIPIRDGDGIIGALDVQSRVSNAFTNNEIRILNVITNQLATAIRNARLFERQAHNLDENKRLFIESETNLREIQRLNRQLTRQAWADYLKMDRRIIGVTLDGQRFNNKAQWTDKMVESGQRRRPIAFEEDGADKIAVPIELRGEVVGAIEIDIDSASNESTIDMIQAISQRLAVSLDNARLFEETQEATAQEQRIGELVSQYQSANTVDDLLQITLEGLIETLGAEAGAIRLGRLPEDIAPPIEEANGHAHNGSETL
ncbi:MAG: GAF domain-containing protein [Anaerolineae bacterium]|nr:GAF domain-containing protein [Anaerolineae bacterium]MDQ7036923.1 GAF domain-containing protein [Anaerolineae bacterium]